MPLALIAMRRPMPTRPPARAHAHARTQARTQPRTQASPQAHTRAPPLKPARTAAHIATALLIACLSACASTTRAPDTALSAGHSAAAPSTAPRTTATRNTPAPDPATYAQLGGAPGIEAIVDDLLLAILEDDRINLQFADADIIRLREKLIEQLCTESGGPCTYTGLTMHESHAGRGIDQAQFNALVENLIDVMTKRSVPVGAQNRLLKRLAPMYRDIVER